MIDERAVRVQLEEVREKLREAQASLEELSRLLVERREPTEQGGSTVEIKHKIEFVDGPFDTMTGKLICVGNRKHGTVSLCFKANMNIGFAKIRLHSRDRAIDADAVFEDALSLGKEIARRWNIYDPTPRDTQGGPVDSPTTPTEAEERKP